MNRRVIWPCVPECGDRSPDCHATCPRYLDAKRQHRELKEEELAAKIRAQEINDLEWAGRRRRSGRK